MSVNPRCGKSAYRVTVAVLVSGRGGGHLPFVFVAVLLSSAFAPEVAVAQDADENVTTWIVPPAPEHRPVWGLLDLNRSLGSTPWVQSHSLTGNWGGWRDRIADEYGLSIDGSYTSQCAGNPVGGRSQGVTYTHNIGIALLADLGPLVGLDQTYFIVSGSNRVGASLSFKYIGNIFDTQEIYGGE